MKFINDILNRFSKKTTGLMLGDYVNYSGIKDDAKLIDEGFITSADVYSIVSFIAMKSGDLPIDIFTDGEKQDEGNIFDIIYNNELPKEELLNRLNTFQGLTGDNFILKTEVPQFDANMNRVSKMILEPLYPQNVFINIDYSSGAIKNYEYNDGYKIKKYEPEEIIHVKYFDPSINGLTDLRGLSPLQAGYMAMIASNNRSHANASMLKNGGVKGILTGETGGDGLSHALGDNIEKIQEELNKRLGQTGNFNSIYATKSSYKYTPIGMNANDLKIIESQAINLRELCNIFHLPSQLFNDSANKTYNNQKAGEIAAIENGVVPPTNKILSAIAQDLSKPKQLGGMGIDINFKVNTENLPQLQENQKQEAEKNTIIANGIINVVQSYNRAELTKEQTTAILRDNWGKSDDEIKELL